jgi:putative oxidoreductase
MKESAKVLKIAVLVVRLLMGAMFLFASVTFLFKLFTPPELTGNLKVAMDGFTATGYLMYLIKITELVCALAYLSGRFTPLANVVLFPITLNIVLFHALLAPDGLATGVVLLAANLFLAWAARNHYRGLFAAKLNLDAGA